MHADRGGAGGRAREAGDGAEAEVAGALAGAAGQQQQVAAGEGGVEGGGEGRAVVGGDAEAEGLGAELLAGVGEQGLVAVVDLSRSERFAGGDDLVAGREHADPRPAVHDRGGAADRGEHPGLARAEGDAGAQDDLAAGDVRAREGDHAARRDRSADQQHAGLDLGVLDHHDRVGAARDHAAGGDRHRLAGLQVERRRDPAGQQLGAQGQAPRGGLAGAVAVRGLQRVAVDVAAVEARDVAGGGDGLGEHPTAQAREGDGLGRQRPRRCGGPPAGAGLVAVDDVQELSLLAHCGPLSTTVNECRCSLTTGLRARRRDTR